MKETMDSIAARADDCMGRGDWDGAERIFLAALTEAEETGDRRAALSLCSELMGFYRQRADAEKFYPVLGRCTELLGEVRPGAAARGTILINAATALAAFGEAQRALPLFREAESLYAVSLGRRSSAPCRRFIITCRGARCAASPGQRRSGTCSARWKTRKSVPAISISR